jgi:hypothetical protein
VEVVNCDTDLTEIALTLHSTCRFTRRLNSGQKNRNQYPNYRDHNQKLNKSKTK